MTTSNRGGGVATSQGTSYATPVVSACVAALREALPTATVTDLMTAIATSPTMVVDTTSGRSFPRLDCNAALNVILPPPVPAFPGGLGWRLVEVGLLHQAVDRCAMW